MTVPHIIGGFHNAVILHTDPTGEWQVAAWYTVENTEPGVPRGELRVGRIRRGQQQWGIDHDWFQVDGTLRTNLGLPVGNDDHNFPVVAVDGLGKIHIWCDMHASTMRHAVTIDPHTSDGWLTSAGWEIEALPSVGATNTYPFPTQLPDGTLLFYARSDGVAGGSGGSNSLLWRRGPAADDWDTPVMLFQGNDVPDAKGPGIPGDGLGTNTEFNWSAYPTILHCESPRGVNPGRLHMAWLWRIFAVPERPNVLMSYARSDDDGQTWETVDGTPVTLPVTPLNNLAARIPGHARITAITRAGGFVAATLDQTAAAAGITTGQTYHVHVPSDTSFDGTFTIAQVGPGGFFAPGANQIAYVQAGSTATAPNPGYIGRDDYINNGHMTVDDDGHPHFLISYPLAAGDDTWYVHHNGGIWSQSKVPNPLDGVTHMGAPSCVWLRDQLWMLKAGSNVTGFRRPRLWTLTGATGHVVAGGEIQPTGGWEPSYDPQAYRQFGTIEILTPTGNTPRVTVFGRRTRVRPRAA